MTLPIIRASGIEAYCSDLVIDENSWIYFLAVAGYQTAVKGIIANILEYRTVTVMVGDEYHYITRASENYTIHYQKLPSGLFQGAILPKISVPNCDESKDAFLVLAENVSSAKVLFFDHLEEKTEIPLHKDWLNWLWKTFTDNGWLIPLETLIGGYSGFLVDIYEDDLRDAITMEIRERNPQIMRCFEKGGAYADK